MNEKMTLEEFFALADRVAGALNVLREARGERPLTAPAAAAFPLSHIGAEIRYVPGPPTAMAAPLTNKGAVQWTPEELARKEALRAKQAAAPPVDPVMQALEANDEPQ